MFLILQSSTSLTVIVLVLAQLSATTVGEECVSGVFDAITRTSDGETYAFKGNMVSKLTPSGEYISPGYPRPIQSVFAGLPSNLDAALYWARTGKTYFFKGCVYYTYSGTSRDSGYPRSLSSDWQGVPCNLDAALVWGGNGKTYFFKGSEYWRFNRDTQRVDSGYPLAITEWRRLPSPVDAAFQWKNGRTYFFRGQQYYKYNDGSNRVESNYPLVTTGNWLGCEKSNPLSQPTRDMGYFVSQVC